MSRTALALAALGFFALTSPQAHAVPLDPSPDAKARPVVNAVFRDYISKLVGVQIETAIVDVEGDGVGEIVARFVHTNSCRSGMNQCRTVVIRHDATQWVVILDRPADVIDIPKAKRHWDFAEISVDGAKWNWNGKAYGPSRNGLGQKVVFEPVPRSSVGAIAVAFGAGAAKLAANASSGISFEFARPTISAKGDHLLVRMKGDGACGDVAGCPVRLLEKEGETWRSVLDGSAQGDVSVSRVAREGRSDIVLGTDNGYVVMGWTGKSYGIAEVVEATAAPRK